MMKLERLGVGTDSGCDRGAGVFRRHTHGKRRGHRLHSAAVVTVPAPTR